MRVEIDLEKEEEHFLERYFIGYYRERFNRKITIQEAIRCCIQELMHQSIDEEFNRVPLEVKLRIIEEYEKEKGGKKNG